MNEKKSNFWTYAGICIVVLIALYFLFRPITPMSAEEIAVQSAVCDELVEEARESMSSSDAELGSEFEMLDFAYSPKLNTCIYGLQIKLRADDTYGDEIAVIIGNYVARTSEEDSNLGEMLYQNTLESYTDETLVPFWEAYHREFESYL